VPNPGSPEIRPLPDEAAEYLAKVQAIPRFAMTVDGFPCEIKLVEIDPLLSFQVHIETNRANDLWAEAGGKSDLESLLKLCLPIEIADIQPGHGVVMTPDPANTDEKGSFTFEAHNPNVRLWAKGPLGNDDNHKVYLAGIALGEGSRLVQVARLGGRVYLRNGYHRASKIRAAGGTHMPCLVLDVANYSQTGARGDLTLPQRLLESANPPVFAHYSRAMEVTLRGPARRIIKVSWSDQLRF
jgi:hypothetical protein